jgi:hypothetical protein
MRVVKPLSRHKPPAAIYSTVGLTTRILGVIFRLAEATQKDKSFRVAFRQFESNTQTATGGAGLPVLFASAI